MDNRCILATGDGLTLTEYMFKRILTVRRDHCSPRNRSRNIPDQSHLVPAMEPQSLLRESLRRNHFQRTGAALSTWAGRTIRNHQSQRELERRIACASANANRSVEERSDPAPPISVDRRRPRKDFPRTCSTGFSGPGGWRKVAVSQLSRQSTLRRAEPVSLIHGEHSPAPQREGLRILHDAARRVTQEVRSNAGRTEAA